MITKGQIKTGIQENAVRFIIDPNMGHGTVCEIGEHWFYFGGKTAEEENPSEFLQSADPDEVIDSIVEALEGIRDDLDGGDEYRYYEAVLKEGGIGHGDG